MNREDDFARLNGGPGDPLDVAIRADRAANPAPRLSQAALERIIAASPQPRSSYDFLVDALRRIAGQFRPPVWGALAASGFAGLIAGAFLPAATVSTASLTPEEEFIAYLETGDGLTAFLQEEL